MAKATVDILHDEFGPEVAGKFIKNVIREQNDRGTRRHGKAWEYKGVRGLYRAFIWGSYYGKSSYWSGLVRQLKRRGYPYRG